MIQDSLVRAAGGWDASDRHASPPGRCAVGTSRWQTGNCLPPFGGLTKGSIHGRCHQKRSRGRVRPDGLSRSEGLSGSRRQSREAQANESQTTDLRSAPVWLWAALGAVCRGTTHGRAGGLETSPRPVSSRLSSVLGRFGNKSPAPAVQLNACPACRPMEAAGRHPWTIASRVSGSLFDA